MKKVIVIGAGISGLAAAYWLMRKGFDVEIFEKENRVGGVIQTFRENGYLFEKGPNSFLDNGVETMELCHELKLENDLLKQSMRGNARYVYQYFLVNQEPINLELPDTILIARFSHLQDTSYTGTISNVFSYCGKVDNITYEDDTTTLGGCE